MTVNFYSKTGNVKKSATNSIKIKHQKEGIAESILLKESMPLKEDKVLKKRQDIQSKT